MRGLYFIFLWLLGLLLVSVGWYAGAGIIALLGVVTLIFGAYVAYIQKGGQSP